MKILTKTNKMKKTIFILTISIVIAAGPMFTGCQSSAKKVENAQDKVQDAKDDVIAAKEELDQAQRDSVQLFKKESEEKIAAHEKSIAEFKARIATEENANKVKYDKKLAELEQQNTDLKKNLDEFKADSKDNWVAFKVKFKNDLDNLGQALKGFVVKK
jgi:hypothetical protein